MQKHFRKWGMWFVAILLIASTLAPSTAVAWPPGGQPVDDGEGITGPERESIGDPDDGSSGAPRRIQDELSMVTRLLIAQYLTAHVDSRVVHWKGLLRDVYRRQGGFGDQ